MFLTEHYTSDKVKMKVIGRRNICWCIFPGLKICGGCSLDGEELYGIFVKRVLPGGLADQEGKIP